MKDKMGKPLNREFAPNKRPTREDLYKIRVVPKDPDYAVTQEDGRIRVHQRIKVKKEE